MRVTRAVLAATVIASALFVGAPDARGQSGELAEARERANRAAQALADAESRVGTLEAQVAEQQAAFDRANAALEGLRSTMRETAVAARKMPRGPL